MVKVAEILTKKGVKAFFEVDYDGQHLTYSRYEPALGKEALRDGKFLVKTNTQLPAAEVVLSYKTLMNVERSLEITALPCGLPLSVLPKINICFRKVVLQTSK